MKHRGGFGARFAGRGTVRCLTAVSLVELLVILTIIAIMGAVTIPRILNVSPAVTYETARRNLNFLNGAVLNFNQSNWELVFTAASGGTADEEAIFNSLRYRDPTNPAPGSPYLPSNAQFVSSSLNTDYRARWTGRLFEMVPQGSTGSGLDLLKMMGAESQSTATNTPVPPQ